MNTTYKLNYNSSSRPPRPSCGGSAAMEKRIRSSREDVDVDEDDNNQRENAEAIENFSNIELPHTIFYVGGGGRQETKNEKSPVVEGFDQDSLEKDIKDPKKAMKTLKKVAMAPVAFMMNMNPSSITDNKNVDFVINYLAGPSIINRMFYTTSAELLALQHLLVPDPDDKKKNVLLTWTDYFKKKFDIDHLKETAEAAKDTYDKQAAELKQAMEDAKEGRTAAKKKEIRPRRTKNAELEADRVIVKDYMFKTILLVFSFFSVYNWAYYFIGFSGLSGPPEKPCDKYEDRWSDGIPIIGFIAKFFRENFSPTFRSFNPFFLTEKIFAGISDFLKYVSDKDMKESFNKEIWFLLIFAFTFFSSLFFIGKYDAYMKDIRNMRQNKMILFFYICCIYLYLESFISDFGLDKKLSLASGGLWTLLYFFIKNVVIIFLIATNPYIALFLLMMYYLFITIAGIAFYPSISFSDVPKRYTHLVHEIDESYKNDTSMDSIIWVFIRSIVHIIYSNMTISILGAWIIYLYFTLNKKLKYASLRENINTLLAMSMFLLIFILLVIKLYNAAAAPASPAVGGGGS